MTNLSILEWDDNKNKFKISAKTAAHFAQTYGIPKEMFIEMVNNLTPKQLQDLKLEAAFNFMK